MITGERFVAKILNGDQNAAALIFIRTNNSQATFVLADNLPANFCSFFHINLVGRFELRSGLRAVHHAALHAEEIDRARDHLLVDQEGDEARDDAIDHKHRLRMRETRGHRTLQREEPERERAQDHRHVRDVARIDERHVIYQPGEHAQRADDQDGRGIVGDLLEHGREDARVRRRGVRDDAGQVIGRAHLLRRQHEAEECGSPEKGFKSCSFHKLFVR